MVPWRNEVCPWGGGCPMRVHSRSCPHHPSRTACRPDTDQIAFLRPPFCTGARWNSATCGVNQGDWKRRFAPALRASLLAAVHRVEPASHHQPSEREQIVASGERQYKTRACKRRFECVDMCQCVDMRHLTSPLPATQTSAGNEVTSLTRISREGT